VEQVEILASQLKAGNDVLSLALKTDSNATRHVMHDYVSLALP